MIEGSGEQEIGDRWIRSFGRIKSRKLSDHKKFLLKNLLSTYQIPKQVRDDNLVCIHNMTYTCHPELVSGSKIEIGFGFGDFLFEKAKKNPDKNFFGCEPHLNGVVNLLAKLEKEPLSNLKISQEDVRVFLQNFPDNFFDEIYILFPDPWPKLKHFKRRLITTKFLDEILSPKMKKAARLIIATDHDSYKTWILSEILHSKKFFWLANSKKDWQIFPENWTKTKYQKKAENEGRIPIILNL